MQWIVGSEWACSERGNAEQETSTPPQHELQEPQFSAVEVYNNIRQKRWMTRGEERHPTTSQKQQRMMRGVERQAHNNIKKTVDERGRTTSHNNVEKTGGERG